MLWPADLLAPRSQGLHKLPLSIQTGPTAWRVERLVLEEPRDIFPETAVREEEGTGLHHTAGPQSPGLHGEAVPPFVHLSCFL